MNSTDHESLNQKEDSNQQTVIHVSYKIVGNWSENKISTQLTHDKASASGSSNHTTLVSHS